LANPHCSGSIHGIFVAGVFDCDHHHGGTYLQVLLECVYVCVRWDSNARLYNFWLSCKWLITDADV
jgi:hypothetical protein